MKKFCCFLLLVFSFCLIACNNVQLMENKVGSVSFTLGEVLAKEIRSVASFRSITSGTSYTVTGVLSGDYSTDTSVTVDSGALAKATFSFENIPVGISVTLHLTVQAGNNLVWIGNSESHEVVAGNNSLTVALGRVSGVLMWDNSSVNIAPYGNYEAKTSLLTTEWPYPVWCFDNLGNVYWYTDGQNGASRYDLQPDGSYISSEIFYNAPPFYAFSYDDVTDILYGIGDGGSVKYWSDTESDPKDIMDSEANVLFAGESLGFAVHDNIAYIANYAETQDGGEDAPILGVVQFSSYKLEDTSNGTKNATLFLDNKTFTLPEIFGSNPPSSQMIYHEGSLYLLLSRVSIDTMYDTSVPTESYSLGAVLKINPDTLALDTSFGSQGYLGLADTSQTISGINATDAVTDGTVEYSGPDSSNDASVFYGPQGFVAIMPKKLVIADAGFTMSKDGVQAKITKKSRIITVDLETLAFETVDVNGSYYQPSITSTGSGYEYIKQEETSS
ncbi:MAG: hypothetical protein J6R67_11845 [Treponema sp.]|nr:hypothetical protein [Treponema sp.]